MDDRELREIRATVLRMRAAELEERADLLRTAADIPDMENEWRAEAAKLRKLADREEAYGTVEDEGRSRAQDERRSRGREGAD